MGPSLEMNDRTFLFTLPRLRDHCFEIDRNDTTVTRSASFWSLRSESPPRGLLTKCMERKKNKMFAGKGRPYEQSSDQSRRNYNAQLPA